MSTEPPTSADTETDHDDGETSAEIGAIGLSGTVSLGGQAAAKEVEGLQRPPFAEKPVSEKPVVDKPAEEEVPEATVPPMAAEVTARADISSEGAPSDETTRPPSTTMRFSTPAELYAGFPEVKALTLHRPRDTETVHDYLARLRGSTTPEEAVTVTAFAAQPAMAIWWAYGCLRTMADTLSPEDRGMMEMVAMWSGNPDNANRWRVMKSALYAPKLTPVGYLGLAVGWSGGPVAPNDPAPVPAWRTPKAVNTAVLSSIAQVSLQERSRALARFIDLAGKMFEV